MDEDCLPDYISKKDMDDIERIQDLVEKGQQRQDRIEKLEEIAHNNMTDEEIGMQLDDVDPALRKEYEKLMAEED